MRVHDLGEAEPKKNGEEIKNKNKLVAFFIKNNPLFTNAYFVGDTKNDAKAAKTNNLKFIKVNFGSDIEQIRESKLEDSVSIFTGSIKCLCVPKILIVDDVEFNILTI